MMQVTGRTNPLTKNSLSIQISLNGHSFLYRIVENGTISNPFSIRALKDHVKNNDIKEVIFHFSQNQHIVLPTEIFKEEDSTKYLATKNIRNIQNTTHNSFENLTVVYPCIKELNKEIALISELCSTSICHIFVELLKMNSRLGDDSISLSYVDDYLYIVVKTNDEVSVIESFMINDESEIISTIERIIDNEKIENYTIEWFGCLSENTKSKLKIKSNK